MNTLSNDVITRVGSEVDSDLIYNITTVSYIQSLLRPYAEAIEMATDVEGIQAWIPQVFPGELGSHVLHKMNTDVKEVDKLVAAKNSVIEYLMSMILELASRDVKSSNDETVLPWDIQRAIGEDEELAPLFGITRSDNQLPVSVVVNEQVFTHMLTMEFTIGLLLFSTKNVSDHDFFITMFDAPLTSEYLYPTSDDQVSEHFHRFDYAPVPNDIYGAEFSAAVASTGAKFSVEVAGTQYGFNTTDFMQGFATGAQWIEVDHHAYWKNLLSYSPTGEATAISF
jgi:hypothetical protein